MRADLLLVQGGFFLTREQAKRAIMAGLILANGERIDKAGSLVPTNAQIEVKGQIHPYVSRGGLKLEKAIKEFAIDFNNKCVIDIGASTGGFTDCSLQHGARHVIAVDVGYGQLDWKLRQDSRVTVLERTNFRLMKVEQLSGFLPEIAVIDVSFISLRLIFPVLKGLLLPQGEIVALIKPQFEAGREQVGKGGIVHDEEIHQRVIEEVIAAALQNQLVIERVSYSPITGGEGNIEFLCYGRLSSEGEGLSTLITSQLIRGTVSAAHQQFKA